MIGLSVVPDLNRRISGRTRARLAGLCRGERGLLYLDYGLAAQPGVAGCLAAADAEQPFGPHQVDDKQQVDRERPDLQPGDVPRGQVPELLVWKFKHFQTRRAPSCRHDSADVAQSTDQAASARPQTAFLYGIEQSGEGEPGEM